MALFFKIDFKESTTRKISRSEEVHAKQTPNKSSKIKILLISALFCNPKVRFLGDTRSLTYLNKRWITKYQYFYLSKAGIKTRLGKKKITILRVFIILLFFLFFFFPSMKLRSLVWGKVQPKLLKKFYGTIFWKNLTLEGNGTSVAMF